MFKLSEESFKIHYYLKYSAVLNKSQYQCVKSAYALFQSVSTCRYKDILM